MDEIRVASTWLTSRQATPSDGRVATTPSAMSPRCAGFWRRFLAVFVDRLVLLVPLALVESTFEGVLVSLTIEPVEDQSWSLPLLMWSAAYFISILIVEGLYYAGLESSSWQATLGK